MEFVPWVSSTEQVKFGPEMAAGEPLQVTVDTPDKLSPSLPLRPMAIVLRLIVDPLAGEAIATAGGVVSSLIVTDAFAAFPAASVAVPAMS